MADSGGGSSFWQTLKYSLSLGQSYEEKPHQKPDEFDTNALKPKLSGEVLSDADVNGLPPLQQNGGSHLHTPHPEPSLREQRRSNSWLRRISTKSRRSSESGNFAPDAGRLSGTSQDLNRRGSHSSLSRKESHGGLSRRQSHASSIGEPIPEKASRLGEEKPNDIYTDSPRAEFLRAYDAATLQLCNSLSGKSASSVGDTGFQDVAPWNRQPGFLGHLTGQQQEALHEMKTAFPESKQWHTDHDLLRFLRAREFDVRKAKDMYRKYIDEYRETYMVSPNPPIRPTQGPFKVDLVKLYPERDAALTERLQKLMDWFLHTVAFGTDREGRPVVYFRPGDILNQKMTKYVPIADRIAFQSTSNEMLGVLTKMASQNAGFHIDSIIQVLDLGGMSSMQIVSHMRNADAQQEWQHNMDFHPEVLHRIYVISAPAGMPLVWKVASPFLPAATKQKVEVLGSDYRKVLEKAIGSENLPSCYGGKTPFEWKPHRKVKELQY